MSELQRLKALALLIAPCRPWSNETMARIGVILDRLGELLPIDEFEAFAERVR